MAKNRNLALLAVVIVALLGNALITPIPRANAQISTNPIPGDICVFQDPTADGNLAGHVYMNPAWPWRYQRDPVFPGLHFSEGQWAGLDIDTPVRLPFTTGGTVIWVGDDSSGGADNTGGNGVVYRGNGACSNWIAAFWHNPSPVAYTIGQEISASDLAANPGCSGFDRYCGEGSGLTQPHTHMSVGYWASDDPFPAEIPAYHTNSRNPIFGSVWWVNALRLVPSVTETTRDMIWYKSSEKTETTTAVVTPPSVLPSGNLMVLVLLCIGALAALLWFMTGGKVRQVTLISLIALGGIWVMVNFEFQPTPPPTPTPNPTPIPTRVYKTPSWYKNAESGTLSEKGAANGTGWQIIKQAVADAGGTIDQAELLFWAWQSETSVVDCTPWAEKFTADGLPNPCVSRSYAKGPFQFMDGTWVKYADRGWNKWTLYGATRGAYEEFTGLNLWDQPDAESFANRFSGKDGGHVWNRAPAGYYQALWIYNNFLTTDPE